MSNTIKIIFTSDVHGKVFPHDYSTGKEGAFGLLKLASLINEIRDENTVLIDNGDTLQGSALQLYHFVRGEKKPSPVTKAMAAMKYDYLNIGNHDLDYGIEPLTEHIEATGARCININMGFPYDVLWRGGKKIAIFGLLTAYTQKWQSEDKIRGLTFQNDFTLAQNIASTIKKEEAPDYIICCYHGGFEKNPADGSPMPGAEGENLALKMLEEIPEIDLLLAGHQHTVCCGRYRGKAYVQPGADGSFLGLAEIDLSGGEVSTQLVSLEKEQPPPDGIIAAALQSVEEACQRWLDKPIGECKTDLRILDEGEARLKKAPLITFLNMVQQDRIGGDLSASSLFEGSRGFGKSICTRDVIASYAYPNTLQLKRISGKILREYLEKNLEYWALRDGEIVVNPQYLQPVPMHFNYDMIDGADYAADISRPAGKRLLWLKVHGKEVSDGDEFSIALNNYRAAGGGGFSMLAELETIKNDMTDMTEVITQYIIRHGVIDFCPIQNIKIFSGTEKRKETEHEKRSL